MDKKLFISDIDKNDFLVNPETSIGDLPEEAPIFASNNTEGIDIVSLVFTSMPETQEDEVFVTEEQAATLAVQKKYKLFVSYNLGASYIQQYATDDKDDLGLKHRIREAEDDHLRYYVEGDDSVISPQHKAILDFLGNANEPRTIEEQAEALRNKFCR